MSHARTDHQAFLQQIETHRGLLYQVAHAYCAQRQDRADLIQDMVLELWRAFPRYDGRAAFSTWMYKVALNVAISRFRGASRRERSIADDAALGLDLIAADQAMETDHDLIALRQLIAQLEPLNRALILLYLEGHGQDVIAETLGLSTTNVATRINRIKQKLKGLGANPEETA